jgi:hypothetical protein
MVSLTLLLLFHYYVTRRPGQFIYLKIIDFEIKESENNWGYVNDMNYFYTWSRYNSFLDVFDLTLGNNLIPKNNPQNVDKI